MDSSKLKMVYVISSRNGRNYWNRIGVAFVNKDGSINARLDAVPVSGTLQIRDYAPREEGDTAQGLGHERDSGASRELALA